MKATTDEQPWVADILVVDDVPENLRFLVLMLREDGHKVRGVNSGEAALKAAASRPPDLILLDINMPDMSGYEVCAMLKAEPGTQAVPVLFVTALGEEEEEAKGIEMGAIDYIRKPINPAILRARVRNHLELKRKTDELTRLSRTDGLTGLANRRSFFETLEAEWRRSARSGSPVSLLMIDVDFFKAYNDRCGHVAGDECLGRIGQTLRNAMKRAGDVAARYGGEEFVVLLPEIDLEGAVQVAERVRNEISALNIEHAGSTVSGNVTVSVGVASSMPATEELPDSLLKKADAALYEAKKNGRDQVWAG